MKLTSNSGTFIQEKSPVKELLTRVRDGNNKLHAAWMEAIQSDDTGYENMMMRIDKSWPKLNLLCLQLEVAGCKECVYGFSPPCRGDDSLWFCYVCPSARPHWRGADKQLRLEPH
jgi:hypothetical protein